MVVVGPKKKECEKVDDEQKQKPTTKNKEKDKIKSNPPCPEKGPMVLALITPSFVLFHIPPIVLSWYS